MSALADLDFQNPELVANPYPIFDELRKPNKLLWSDRLGLWLAPTYELANATLRARTLGRIYQDKLPQTEWEVFNWLHSDSILDSEPPKHTRLRALVQKAFTPGRIESMRPNVEQLCAELLIEAQAKIE